MVQPKSKISLKISFHYYGVADKVATQTVNCAAGGEFYTRFATYYTCVGIRLASLLRLGKDTFGEVRIPAESDDPLVL